MSDSDDDNVPLAVRKPAPAAAQPPRRAAAPTKLLVETDSDEDDLPIAKKKAAKPAPRPATKASPKEPKPAAVKRKAPAADKAQQPKAKKKATDKPEKEKKVYDLPGQTRDTPEENDPLRKFYATLLEQRPDSGMARKWCVQYGLLSKQEALAWVEGVRDVRSGRTPVKVRPVAKRPAPRPVPKAAKGKKAGVDSEDEDEFKPPSKPTSAAAKKLAAPGKAAAKVPARVKKEEFNFSGDSDDDNVPIGKRAAAAKG